MVEKAIKLLYMDDDTNKVHFLKCESPFLCALDF